MRAIQTELGGEDENEIEEFKNKIEELPLEEDVQKKVLKELSRLKRLPQGSPETAVLRTWIEWIIDLPWTEETEDNLDLDNARKILDEDHYGLHKVKERVIEYLAVCSMTKNLKGPDTLLRGPSRSGQNVHSTLYSSCGRTQVRTHVAGRSAR